MVLTYVKTTAKNSVGYDVLDVVITHPPFYTKEQRQALLDSATMIGFRA
jgi:molecular chaperone DnaK (HSP70)